MGGIIPTNRIGAEIIDDTSRDAVEKFTERIYSKIPKMEAVKIIITNPRARACLIDFLKQKAHLNGRCNYFVSMESFNASLSLESEIDVQDIIEQYTLPETEGKISGDDFSMRDDIQQLLNGERSFPKEEIIKMLEDSKNDAMILLVLEVFPEFVSSEKFKEWRINEGNLAISLAKNSSATSITIPEILSVNLDINSDELVQASASFGSSAIESTVFQTMRSRSLLTLDPRVAVAEVISTETDTSSSDDAIDQALRHIDFLEVGRLLRSGTWLVTFISAVESLPICITLATANKDRIGFPLIYVNSYFEASTGYKREEIMGANCKFLQRDSSGSRRSETQSVDRLAFALRNASPVKVAITNFRKDGVPFKNLLAIKPVMDTAGEYQYVIGVQFDISNNRNCAQTLKLADELITLLPNTVLN